MEVEARIADEIYLPTYLPKVAEEDTYLAYLLALCCSSGIGIGMLRIILYDR